MSGVELTAAFTRFANTVSRFAGRAWTFMICIALVVLWATTGPMFGFSDTWQLVINTSTTIITFMMVFLIQNTQNRDNAALQAKLDELIRVSAAKNEMIGIEKLTDRELEQILADFEYTATPLGRKSEIIVRKVRQARARQDKVVVEKARGSKPRKRKAAA